MKSLLAIEVAHIAENPFGSSAQDTRKGYALVAVALALAGVYFSAAKLGFALAFQAEQVTVVWPPTGIALAAVLLFGYRVWPGIALGAFLANATANETLITASGIATGNTLEALTGAWLMHRLVGLRNPLDHLKGTLGLIILAAAGSTTVSATIGVTSLCLGGAQPWSAFGSLWWLWWLGDASGAVLVTPLLLTMGSKRKTRGRPRGTIEAVLLIVSLVLVSLVVFAGGITPGISNHPLEYTVFPFVAWAALRFGQRGTTSVTFIASGIAIWGTVHGFGPFATGDTHENLILLQAFLAVVAVTALLLAATISERKQTEQDLRLSEETARRQFLELEALYQAAPVGLALIDTSFRYVRLNQTLADIYGVPVIETIGRTLHEVIPEIAPLVEPVYQKVFETKKSILGSEVHGSTAGEPGVERDWLISYYPLKGRNDSVTGVSCIVQEVTERKRAERRRLARLAVTEVLAESATVKEAAPRLLQVICENLGWDTGAIWTVAPEAQKLRCLEAWHAPSLLVPAFEEATRRIVFSPGIGLPGRVWTGGNPAWITDVAKDDNFPRAAMAAQEGLHAGFAFPIRLGSEFLGVIEFFSRQIQAPDADLLEMMTTIGGQIGQFMDRKQAEENLRQRLAELNTLLDILPTGVWIGNQDCSQITGNPAAYEIMGLPKGINASVTATKPEMPTGLRIFAEGVEVHPEDAPMQQVARSGKALRNIEHELVFPDGTRKTVFASIAPLFDDNGKVRGVIGSYADFSERKQMEQALREADRRKNEFLATLAHELRNPLAPISNALQLLRLGGDNREIQAQTRGIMERQTGQMVRLIDDLLDVSRITRNKLQIRKERIVLATALQCALEATQPFIQELAHELIVTLPSEPVYLDADPVRLGQIFTNLLNNAAKFTAKGGKIWLTASSQDGWLLASVRDTGIGIASEHLPRLFEMFSQVTPALERSQGGLGIGLSLARGLVELHGGSIEARSGGLGLGSEFIVRLPIAAIPVQIQAQNGVGKGFSSVPNCRILVADDNEDSVASLAKLLQLLGHDVRTSHDGLDAMQAAETFRPNVALLDIGMPKMNGYEVARLIREQPWGKGLILVALTGWGQEEDKQRALKAGFDHHLTKPVDIEAVLNLLAKPIKSTKL